MEITAKVTTYDAVAKLLLAQGDELHPAVRKAVDDGITSDEAAYSPTYLHVAIAEAGTVLRRTPSVKLTKKPIGDGSMPEADVTAGTLIRMIQASHTRVQCGSKGNNFQSRQAKALRTCIGTEGWFLSALDSLERYPRSHRDGLGNCVVMSQDTPVLLKKGWGSEPSALTLVDTTINGIPYPAGSVTRIDFQRDRRYKPDGTSYFSQPPKPRWLETVPVDEIAEIGFLRLSAFALQGAEREVFEPVFRPYAETADHPYRHLTGVGIAAIQQIVANAIAKI